MGPLRTQISVTFMFDWRENIQITSWSWLNCWRGAWVLEKPPNKRIYNFRFHSVKNRLPFLFRVPECLVNGWIVLLWYHFLFYFISSYFHLNFSIKSPLLLKDQTQYNHITITQLGAVVVCQCLVVNDKREEAPPP